MILEVGSETMDLVDPYFFEGLRPMWITLGLLYGMAATYLASSQTPYPRWAWTTFYLISVGILIYFNAEFWVSSKFVLLVIELLIWLAAAVGGVVLFGLLLDRSESVGKGTEDWPTSRELASTLCRWVRELFSR